MKLYNTLTQRKEDFVPQTPGKVLIYGCGPTVYNFMHVGNARMAVTFDALRRYFEYRGYGVTYVQNFTDIDDKIIRRAAEEGITWREVSDKYIAGYFADARALGIGDATVHPLATAHIPEIIATIEKLIAKDLAYAVNGDVYYRTERFADYGKLSHQPLENLRAGARIEVGESKDNPMDFALWKSAKPGEPSWASPWGDGRPGWHIECSAMSAKYLGDTFDIHCGGVDLVFPHHENEIAQSEGANGVPFAKYWLHNGMITTNKRKMSKSAGNFFTVREAAAVYGYATIRYFVLSGHYRSPLDYSADVLEQCRAALARLTNARDNYAFLAKSGGGEPAGARRGADSAAFLARFTAALDDDFNTADAIGILFDAVRDCNSALAVSPSKALAESALALFDEMNGVLGLVFEKRDSAADTAKIESLVAERDAARAAKNWARSDELRDELKSLGVTVEDTKQGAKWTLAADGPM
ncbi:MAG: cysteine--tRNA ligase [Oscillospiraceae bacterium]|jgi:cysteinyl-tRNA synthetase|nr:cysteine--tRNA ligase [Oscillospiraceae bacterium]